jgi:hypothetical protein
VFEISAKDTVHQFAETMKAIAYSISQEYMHGGMQGFNFVRPVDPLANAKQFNVKSLKKQLDLFRKR